MDRLWQWAWDRYGARYSWVIWVGVFASTLAAYLLWSFVVVAFEKSTHYVEAAVVTGAAVLVMSLVVHRPESRRSRLAQRWAAGDEVDREAALEDTYTWTRNTGVRALWFFPIWGALLLIVVGVVAGASGSRLVPGRDLSSTGSWALSPQELAWR
jgi:adenylate cyclase